MGTTRLLCRSAAAPSMLARPTPWPPGGACHLPGGASPAAAAAHSPAQPCRWRSFSRNYCPVLEPRELKLHAHLLQLHLGAALRSLGSPAPPWLAPRAALQGQVIPAPCHWPRGRPWRTVTSVAPGSLCPHKFPSPLQVVVGGVWLGCLLPGAGRRK